ncbi:cysteine proteinase [Pseudovirgaria hyperparasitica]|uniref:Cysteine proteinase n=1 Tax=Pseudovirgaria hyperparasitica TaxID=470096 RepID=A0A6A6WHZ4_9PEZI|nr:cysteine proteinase [Pseudovirgaria hyperparasitica]KAF2760771.1 cysteine proteinase [Pseudovirgaria hyperparasitica]
MEALEAQIADLQEKITQAPTQSQALKLALRSADLCIEAIKVAKTEPKREELRGKANSLIGQAESIKHEKAWRPSPTVAEITSAIKSTTLTHVEPKPSASTEVPVAKIRKLEGPKTTRELSAGEKLILWKASKLNDSNFPPWTDPPDDAEFQTPFVDRELKLSEQQRELFEGWKRVKDALPPPAWRLANDIPTASAYELTSSVDLVQDAASDCSVVASLCSAAARAQRNFPWIISDSIWPRSLDRSHPIASPNGKYILKLNFNGCWRKVVIDDRLPVSKNTRLLHVVDRKHPALIWPALVEKAYLKVRGGYDFPGSSSCSDLWAFTGWIPEQIFLQADDILPDALWNRIIRAFRFGDVFVTVGTGHLARKEENNYGLVSRHNYAVIDMKGSAGDRMLLLKNPWLTGTQWNSNLQKASTTDSALPAGSDWFTFEQVMSRFESIFLNWNPGLFSFRQDLHFQWNIKVKSPASLGGNPQFSLVTKADGFVFLLLNRHFQNERLGSEGSSAVGELPTGYISLTAYDSRGERVHLDEGCIERSPFVSTPQALLRLDMKAHMANTIVVAQQELPPITFGFSLSAFSNVDVELSHVNEEQICKVDITGVWKSGSSGGSQSSSRYYENPQFALTVPARTSLSMILESPADDIPIHVAIVHGRGERVFKLRSQDIIVQAETYRPGVVLANVSDLDSGTYTVICSTFEAGQHAEFTLTANATCRCLLRKIPTEGAGKFAYKLNQLCFGTENSKMAANLIPKRQVKFNIVASFIKVRVRPGMDSTDCGRSPLRITIDVGRGPDKKTILASNEGAFSDAQVVRTDTVDLYPRLLAHGDLWLVMERLAGPDPGFEELYEVQLFMDVPNGVQLGNWRGWDD